MKIWVWAALAVMIVALVGASIWVSKPEEGPRRVEVAGELERVVEKHSLEPKQDAPIKEGKMNLGRVVTLDTNKGTIEFVLFEKDCPKTTRRIADLVSGGKYDGVKFWRVESFVIQTDDAKQQVPPMGCEVLKGLNNVKGTVAMARAQSPDSNTSQFYILKEPQPHLDMSYTVFGRVIRGMDVVLGICPDDVIKRATIRPLTSADNKRFDEILTIQAERETQ